jgi:hypothetical protein
MTRDVDSTIGLIARITALTAEINKIDAERSTVVGEARTAGVPWVVIAEAMNLSYPSPWAAYTGARDLIATIVGQTGMDESDAIGLARAIVGEVRLGRQAR